MNASRECKLPELTEIAKFTVGSSKQHNTLQTLITRVLCLQKQFISNVVKQDRRILLVVYLSTFLFAQVLIRSERMYRCRRPIIFRLINLAFLTLFVTAILAVPLMCSMLGTREVEFKLRSVILPKQIEISMFMYYCNPGKRRAD